MIPPTLALQLLFTSAVDPGGIVTVSRHCRVRRERSTQSHTFLYLRPGDSVEARGSATPDTWVPVSTVRGDGWVGPECRWLGSGGARPANRTEQATADSDASHTHDHVCPEAPPCPPPLPCPSCPPCEASPAEVPAPPAAEVDDGRSDSRPSYGGVFMGASRAYDPYLSAGGQLSVGGLALLRVEDSPWFAGLSAAYVGGSRFQRVVIPYVPQLPQSNPNGTTEGLANVASIYTDIRLIPISTYVARGVSFGRLELLLGAGPSAHRVGIRRREQVTGLQQLTVQEETRPGESQSLDPEAESNTEGQDLMTTYTIDRVFSGESRRWAAGGSLMAGAMVDVGAMPFVRGRWSLGGVALASMPIGRQGCGDLGNDDIAFGSVCVPLEYTEKRRSYYTEGKEDTDQAYGQNQTLFVPVQAFTWSVNAALLFQF